MGRKLLLNSPVLSKSSPQPGELSLPERTGQSPARFVIGSVRLNGQNGIPTVPSLQVPWSGQELGTDGVFRDLHSLETGDKVIVNRKDGQVARFRVTRIASFEKSKFPSELVYGNVDDAALRLITCDNFNPDTGAYRSNLVVFATLI